MTILRYFRTAVLLTFLVNTAVNLYANYQLGTASMTVGPGSGAESVILSVSPNTDSWSASANSDWLHVTPGFDSGVGGTNVLFTFDANIGQTRTGTLTIAGLTLTVVQAGATYSAATWQTLASGLIGSKGIAVDSSGNVFLTSYYSLLKYTAADGSVSNIAPSAFDGTYAVALDAAGNLYVSEDDAGDVVERAPFGNWVVTASGFNYPHGITLDGAGNIYVADWMGNGVKVWNKTTKVVSAVVPTPVHAPIGVAIDKPVDNVYFTSDGAIYKWSVVASNLTMLDSSFYPEAETLALDGHGNLYSGDFQSHAVKKWSPTNGAASVIFPSISALPIGVAVDAADNVYFCDSYGGVLMELPRAFVDVTTRYEPLQGGMDSLSPVVPATARLTVKLLPTSDQSWLTVTGVTNGVVSFSCATNLTVPSRTGHIKVLGQSVAVVQSGPTFTLGVTNLLEGHDGGSDSVTLSVNPNIGMWTVSSNAAWLHVSPGYLSGTGSTNVVFSFDANPGTDRTGLLTIGGQTVSITQVGTRFLPATPAVTVASNLTVPSGVAVDGKGAVYFSEAGNNDVRMWQPTNNSVVTIASGLNQPRGIAVDSTGNIFIADSGNSVIKEWIASSNSVIALPIAGLSFPSGVAVDRVGNIYIVDTTNNVIEKWNSTSNILTTVISSGLNAPQGVAVDIAGNIYIADTGNHVVKEWSQIQNAFVGPTISGLVQPTGVAVDGSGNIFIADAGAAAVRKWIAASNVVATVLSPNTNSWQAAAVDAAGNLFVSDSSNGTLTEVPHAFVDPSPLAETADGGSDLVPAVLPANANLQGPFTPTTDQPWLTFAGWSNGNVAITFSANANGPRSANLNVLGRSIGVIQNGTSIALGTSNILVGPAAGSASVVLAVAPNTISWTASANAGWLHLSGNGQSGVGSATIGFSVDSNSGPTRSGTLTVAGQTLTVMQAGQTFVPGTLAATLVSGLSRPVGLALDPSGTIFIGDSSVVRAWNPVGGTLTSIVTVTNSSIAGIAEDSAGNLFFAAQLGNTVLEWIAASNMLVTLIPSGVVLQPSGIAVGQYGKVYIADRGHNAIEVYNLTNRTLTTLISSGLSSPAAVAVDAAGSLYVADSGHNAVLKRDIVSGSVTTVVNTGLSNPQGVAVDGQGNVYIADSSHRTVKLWSAATQSVTTLPFVGLNTPQQIAISATGDVFVTDSGARTVQEMPFTMVDVSRRMEPLNGGTDSLAAVIPATAKMTAPFAPVSDQSWLSIIGATNGNINVSFTANGVARQANITLFGKSIPFVQGSIGAAPMIIAQSNTNGLQLSFTNVSGAAFTVLYTTNITLPLSTWTPIGQPAESPAGQYQFTFSQFTNGQGYFGLRSP